jgi:anti-sigma B factor antagonist
LRNSWGAHTLAVEGGAARWGEAQMPELPVFDFEIVTTSDGDHLVRMFGELDLTDAERLDDALAQLQANQQRALIVDLRELTFMDSSGLHCLLDADARARDAGTGFLLIRGSRFPDKLLHMSGLDDHLHFAAPPEEARGGSIHATAEAEPGG